MLQWVNKFGSVYAKVDLSHQEVNRFSVDGRYPLSSSRQLLLLVIFCIYINLDILFQIQIDI